MTTWLKPALILGTVAVLLAGNVWEFTAKRRKDRALIESLEQGSPHERIAARQYNQTRNIEQLLHLTFTVLVAILVTLLWG